MAGIEKSGLSPELIEKARLELNEIQSEVPDQIKSLREKILEDPNRNFRTDDPFLLRFLRARKFDQDRALELMINYYRQREYYPQLFSLTREDTEHILQHQIHAALLNRNSEDRAVIFYNIARWDTSQISFDDQISTILMTMEALLDDESVQINGLLWISDLEGLSMSHVTQMTPWKLKEAVSVLMNSFPVRQKGIHHINESPLFDGLFMIVRPLLSKKLQERIMFHGDVLASLHEQINPEILPEELGGDLEPMDHSNWNNVLLDRYDQFYQDSKKYGFVNSEPKEEQ